VTQALCRKRPQPGLFSLCDYLCFSCTGHPLFPQAIKATEYQKGKLQAKAFQFAAKRGEQEHRNMYGNDPKEYLEHLPHRS